MSPVHACYDAPCQLKLGSTAGLDRGATKQVVYDGARLKAVSPTRLLSMQQVLKAGVKRFLPGIE